MRFPMEISYTCVLELCIFLCKSITCVSYAFHCKNVCFVQKCISLELLLGVFNTTTLVNMIQTKHNEFLLGGYAPQTPTPGRPSASWPGPGPKGPKILVIKASYTLFSPYTMFSSKSAGPCLSGASGCGNGE